jgi:hypothetical protein
MCFSYTIRFTVNFSLYLKTLYKLHIYLAPTEIKEEKLNNIPKFYFSFLSYLFTMLSGLMTPGKY